MSFDLICYIPNHGYATSESIYVSWLDGNYYIRDAATHTFKISTDDSDNNLVQFSETITTGYVREVDLTLNTTTISGLDHLEGETVKVVSDGVLVATETVASGSITVSSDIYTYSVGRPYTMKVRTMRLSIPNPQGTVQSRIKRIYETVTRYLRSSAGRMGQEYSGTEYLSDMNATFSTRAQDTTSPTKGGFSEEAYTVIKSEDPAPLTVLGTVITFEIAEQR